MSLEMGVFQRVLLCYRGVNDAGLLTWWASSGEVKMLRSMV
jgi:hypothetical protein